MPYLNCHSWFSLRYGTFSEEALCHLAKKNDVDQIALTDINSTSGCLKFLKTAATHNIHPVVGIDFRNGNKRRYTALAKTNAGFKNLNSFLSSHLHQKKPFSAEAPNLKDTYFIYPFEDVLNQQKTDFRENEFIGVSVESFRKFKFSAYKNYRQKVVLQQPVSFRNKKDFNAHRLLRAIDNNCLLSQLVAEEQGNPEDKMLSLEKLKDLFQDYEFILSNTESLLKNCSVNFKFDQQENRNLQTYGESQKEDEKTLRKLCYQRVSNRYPDPDKPVYERLEKELNAIIALGFVSYFLINLDIVEFARSQDFPFVGRGSGANSVVAYVLGITNVDPIELDLYFERFINTSRSSPPDFDIDFSWKDRNAVTEYIFNRHKNTALMGTYVTFKRKAVARELGKVFGLPKENIDKLSAGFFNYNQLDHLEKLVIKYSHYIEGFPNYTSVHSGGIVILEKPVHYFSGTILPPKGFQTLQIDMHISEDVGIHKFDILAQRGLPKIKDAMQLVRENQPKAELKDIENIRQFKEDPNINNLLKTGDCMGVFYVESPAMRGLLTKLQTDNYLNLVAASSIIRPGVSSGGMKEEFIKRHRNSKLRKQAHPVMYKIMPDTYGVMVYQEDVMKVAHKFAGLDFADADVLRRGMSGKKTSKGQMERIEAKFHANCKERGYSEKLTDEVWSQISSFAGYAFPKGHSASYAVESYQSLYLKCYFPLEFMVAAINNGGGFYGVETYLQEIRKCGGTVHAPCVNKSEHPTTISGTDVYLGLGYLKSFERQNIQNLLENRNFSGAFQSLEDFLDRVPISVEQVSILIKINAFRFTRKEKHELLWKAHFFLNKQKRVKHQQPLFKPSAKSYHLPHLEHSTLTKAYDQLELLGFTLCNPFQLLKNPLQDSVKAEDLKTHCGRQVCIYGDLITLKSTRTKTGKKMSFGTFFDKEQNVFDTVHFPTTVQRFPVRNRGIYRIFGKVVNELNYLSVEVNSIQFMAVQNDPRFVG
jgi:DNA polymerase-3 subunit alpha